MEGSATALLVAHPGHELLLHHWMERTRPLVFALTDGSGGKGIKRCDQAARVIEAAGGTIGPVFGMAPDRRWYAAVLQGDLRPFSEAVRALRVVCLERKVTCLVTDSVEFFNPMHDLTAAVGRGVARWIRAVAGLDIELFEYPIERHDLERDAPAVRLHLEDGALARKIAAAKAFQALESEVKRHAEDVNTHRVERIYRVDPEAEWPRVVTEQPFYEHFGGRRIAEGLYQDVITYHGHVRPLAVTLSDGLFSC